MGLLAKCLGKVGEVHSALMSLATFNCDLTKRKPVISHSTQTGARAACPQKPEIQNKIDVGNGKRKEVSIFLSVATGVY